MTLFRLLTEGTRILEQAGCPDAKQDARQLLLAAFHLDLVHFLLNRMEELEDSSQNQAAIRMYREMIGRRKRRCPLQQILNRQEFMGFEFYVNAHVLIPRQDTETLVELVLEKEQKEASTGIGSRRLLDLCTGSGCIAVSLGAKGGFETVTGTDISAEALKVAVQNARELLPGWQVRDAGGSFQGKEPCGSGQRIEFFQGDLFDALQRDCLPYDVITSNPPYIPTRVIHTLEPEVWEYEPMLALNGTEDGLEYYRRIAKEAGNYLKPGGRIYLEIGCDQRIAVEGLLLAAGFEGVHTDKDLPGHDRVVSARWNSEEEKNV